VEGNRYLIVTADDFGIGPETSRGILDLAAGGRVTNTVLLVNSPHSVAAVQAWRRSGARLELGWHPCLTLDQPLLSRDQIPSLVAADGRFHRLGVLACRLVLRQIRHEELVLELAAQYRRFIELVGHPPAVINTHHHVQVFPMIGAALRQVLRDAGGLPYLRRIQESWRTLSRVSGARTKRLFLTALGLFEGRRQARVGLPGNEWLAGITDPAYVHDPQFYARWLASVPGRVVELTCHPGYRDETLIGRDCTTEDGQQERRVRELELLRLPAFLDACRQAEFQLVSPTALVAQRARHAA
jgi:chitin disaccharide deacetylase